jgi:hypothetical protein
MGRDYVQRYYGRVKEIKEPTMKKIIILGALICYLASALAAQNNSELNGYVTWPSNAPAKGVVMIIDRYSIATDEKGYYRFSSLKPGEYTVVVSPPNKQSHYFKVTISAKPTQQNFTIDW